MELRQASVIDLPAILKVEQDAFPKTRWASEQSLAKRIDLWPSGTYVCEVDNLLVGFANGFPIKDLKTQAELDPPDPELFDRNGKVWMLRNVAVLKSYQSMGIGALLVKKQIELAIDFSAREIRFTAPKELGKFYSALGFSILRESESFHGISQCVWYGNVKNFAHKS